MCETSDAQHSGLIDTSIIAEVLDGKGPWVALHELFYVTAKKCGWMEICRIHERFDPQKYRYMGLFCILWAWEVFRHESGGDESFSLKL